MTHALGKEFGTQTSVGTSGKSPPALCTESELLLSLVMNGLSAGVGLSF